MIFNMFIFKLPKKYKYKPKNKAFKVKDEEYGLVDTKIYMRSYCKDCGCHGDLKLKSCTRCYSKKLTKVYWIAQCNYSFDYCPVNRWGCSIHYKSIDNHGPVCVCDTCM